jgi:predicted permease
MLESFFIVAKQVAVLFFLIGVGYSCNKLKIFNEETVRGMTNMMLFVVTPCIIVDSFQRPFNSNDLGLLGIALFVAILYHALNIFFAHTCVFEKEQKRQRVMRFGLVFSNAGYMAFPLQEAILGKNGLFIGAIIIAVFNILLWTYGVWEMSGSLFKADGKMSKARQLLSTAKAGIINPGTLGVIFGLIFFFNSITLPEIIGKPVSIIASLNTPIPMIIIGFYLANAKISKVFTDLRAYNMMFLRLIVVPVVLFGLLYVMNIRNHNLVVALVIAASAPAAAATTMFAAKFNQDTLHSVAVVSYSTLISMITMPLVVGFAYWLTK